MIDEYLQAIIRQSRERAKVLKGKIPNPVDSPELTSLQRICEERLDTTIQTLDYLAKDPNIAKKENRNERLRLLRRTIDQISQIEVTGIAALSRTHPDDHFMNRLLFQIHKEIKYPLWSPTVSCLSQDYFAILPSLGLLVVPLAESDFLLHLPDLYHEIAHPLLFVSDNPKVEQLQMEFNKFRDCVLQYFEQKLSDIIRSTGPKEDLAYELKAFELSWLKFWSEEFFCDLFALYTLGPAYAYSHFHLVATRDSDPFRVKIGQSHPPDNARMQVMLKGLSLIDRKNDADCIASRWHELLNTLEAKATPEYRKACPETLLEQAAIHALEGTKKIGCRLAEKNVADKIHCLLNEAWEQFWANPLEYQKWETSKIDEIKQKSDDKVLQN